MSTRPHISVSMTLSASTDSHQRAAPGTAAAVGPAITKPNRAGESPLCWAFRASPRSNTQGSVRAAAWLKASVVAAGGRWPAAEAVRGTPGRAGATRAKKSSKSTRRRRTRLMRCALKRLKTPWCKNSQRGFLRIYRHEPSFSVISKNMLRQRRVAGVTPQVATEQALVALRLKARVMVRHGLRQNRLERKRFRQIREQLPGFCTPKPEAVVKTMVRMAGRQGGAEPDGNMSKNYSF